MLCFFDVDSEPEVFFLRSHARRMEKCAQSTPQVIAHACAARTQIRSFYELHVAGSLHDDE